MVVIICMTYIFIMLCLAVIWFNWTNYISINIRLSNTCYKIPYDSNRWPTKAREQNKSNSNGHKKSICAFLWIYVYSFTLIVMQRQILETYILIVNYWNCNMGGDGRPKFHKHLLLLKELSMILILFHCSWYFSRLASVNVSTYIVHCSKYISFISSKIREYVLKILKFCLVI